MSNWIRFLLQKPLGRALLAGALVIALASLGKYFVDESTETDQERKSTIHAQLESLMDQLRSKLDSGSGSKVEAEAIPKVTGWVPQTLPCGRRSDTFNLEKYPFWKALKLDPELAAAYQFRFDRQNESVRFIARRDADCDGLFEVHTMQDSTGWGPSRSLSIKSQNLGD